MADDNFPICPACGAQYDADGAQHHVETCNGEWRGVPGRRVAQMVAPPGWAWSADLMADRRTSLSQPTLVPLPGWSFADGASGSPVGV